MRAILRLAALSLCLAAFAAGSGRANAAARPAAASSAAATAAATASRRSKKRPSHADEIVREGHRFFGTVSRGLAQVVETAFSRWGEPNGYILGQEGSGAFVVGLRYGDGKLYTRNAGDRRVFWEGPSVGFDTGGEGARTMMLVYNLPATDAIYQRFGGIDGSAYFIGGFGMTALTANNIVVVPIRSGVGLTARRQYRLLEVHAEGDLEPVLDGAI